MSVSLFCTKSAQGDLLVGVGGVGVGWVPIRHLCICICVVCALYLYFSRCLFNSTPLPRVTGWWVGWLVGGRLGICVIVFVYSVFCICVFQGVCITLLYKIRPGWLVGGDWVVGWVGWGPIRHLCNCICVLCALYLCFSRCLLGVCLTLLRWLVWPVGGVGGQLGNTRQLLDGPQPAPLADLCQPNFGKALINLEHISIFLGTEHTYLPNIRVSTELSGGQLGNRRDGCSEVPKLGAFAPDTPVPTFPCPRIPTLCSPLPWVPLPCVPLCPGYPCRCLTFHVLWLVVAWAKVQLMCYMVAWVTW